MKAPGIRARVLIAAILPVTVVTLLLAIVFLAVVVRDLDAAHRQRALALARQVAATSEFAVFTGDRKALQELVNASSRQDDVRALAVLDRGGEVMAQAGLPVLRDSELPSRAEQTREAVSDTRRLVVYPIAASDLSIQSLFEQGDSASQAAPPALLGYVALELGREALVKAERILILAGTAVTLVGLLFGCLVAIRLGRAVTAPIVQVIEVVDRFGQGDHHARVPVSSSGSLRALEEGINRMADRIEQHRDELERRVEEATRELRLKKDEAEHANAAKSRFLAAASHDLRQPIHALRLFADSLRDELADQPRAAALLNRIQDSIEATSGMFDALLDISRLEAGVIAKDVHDFPARALLYRIETIYTPVAVNAGLRFSVVPSSAWLRSDPALLDRVLQNLVSNAIKYTRRGGVLVGCRRRGAHVALQVWDTGPGIAPEHRDDIFEEFVQLDNPARDAGKGLGLGLAIVQRIARLLDHPVGVQSTPGRGSMFSVLVPLGDAAAARGDEVGVPALEHRFPGLRVAVIDDEPSICAGMSELLGRWGCTVTTAASSGELIERLERTGTQVDVLICDYRIGSSETGLEAVADVNRALGRNVPTLLVTGDTAIDRLREVHDSGYLLLHKPVAPAKLRQTLYHLLAASRPSSPT